MTAPRLREQRRPPAPPDRRSPRRGGGSSPYSYAVSAGGPRALAAAACLSVVCALALPATAEAQSLRGDDLPVLEFTKSTVAIEDAGHANVFLKLDRAASVPVKVHWETSELSPATAVAGVDYWPGPGTVTFAPGDVEEQFRVMLRNDDRVEDTEKFLVIIRPANPALVTVPEYEREYTIIDTDELKLTIDVETVVREAARVAHVRVYAEEVPLDFDFNFQYETQPGTVVPEGLQGNNAYTAYVAEAAGLTYAAATEGRDYRHTTGTLTFGPGRLRHTITVPIINDGAEEEPELFQIWMQRVKETDRRIRGPGRAARVVIDRSDYPLVSLWDAEGVEGEDMVFTVALSKATGADVTVDWTVDFWRGSTADAADFETMSGTATVAAGSREATFTVATADDAANEEDETFLVRLSNFSWNSQIGDPTATGVITDNDVSPFEPSVVRNVTVLSGPGPDGVWSAGERVELEVRYSLPVVVRQPRYWVDADGARHPPGPYMLVSFRSDARPGYGEGLSAPLAPYVGGSGTDTLRFAYTVGAAEDGALRVEVGDSGMFLGGATIRTLEGGEGASRYTNTRVMQTTVRKPDGAAWTGGDTVRVAVRFAGPVQYTPPDEPLNRDKVVVDETGGTPSIRLLLGDPERRGLARTASYEGGSGSNTLTFEYEVTAGDGRVSAVEVVADSLASNGATIRNEDGYDAELDHLGVLWYSSLPLRVRDAAAREGGTLKFTMELAQAAKATVTVDYETADGTATAGEDYTAKRGTVRFAPGGTRKTVEVAVLRDEETEDAETVVLRLSNARSEGSEDPVEVTDPEAEGTIEDVAPEASGELTASFEDVPAAHDGTAFTFRVAFSEDIGISFRSLREDAFTVTGGRVTGGTRVDGRRDLFEMTVRPESDDDVTITLQAGRECAVSGAICTKGKNRRKLTNTITATVAGPPDERTTNRPATGAPTIGGTPQVGEELTASTSGIADADGLDDARFAYQWLRNDTDIQGATAPTYTAVDADAGNRLKVRVSFTDDAGNAENLTGAATDAVAARPEPLTASFEGMPAEHRGEGGFHFRVAFSEDIGISFRALREDAFTVTGGRVTGGKRVDGRRDLFRMTVRPESDAAVTITLPAGRECGVSGAICTKGEPRRQLTNSPSARVRGPVGISVADARVEEDDGAVLVFLVTLSRAAGGTLAVDYATSDGSAHAGVDYTAASGRLSFRTGESSKKIKVGVLDDAHDEGEETLTLTLSNASSGRLTDGEATGTIENHDPLPRALLARFGRTAAVHVVEHVEERLAAPREPGFRGRFAGRELRRGMERDIALNVLRQLGGAAGAGPMGAGVHGPLSGAPATAAAPFGMPGPAGGGRLAAASGPMGGAMPMGGAPGAMGMGAGPMGGGSGPAGGLDRGRLLRMSLGGGDVLTGSDFALGRETRHGGILSFWSRGAQSRFSGREGALSLGGDVRTTMFGADYAKGPLVAGLSLSHSRGLGEYAGVAGGQVTSSVTGLYPWLGYKATERVTVWGVAGYGAGGLRLTPQGGPALEAGLSMAMAAAGTRGELVAGGAGGFALAFKADALWVGTATDGVDGPAGRLQATEAAVTRFRTGLEGSRAYTLAGRLSLTPSVEVGLRHDGGDAETGAGMDVGAGLIVSDASTGLAVDVRVRTLVMHQAEGFRERGVAVSLSYNPTPSTPLGFVARVAPSWGGEATSGAEALWGRETMAGMAHGGVADGNRLNAEVGYGLPVGSRFVGTPRVGVSTSEYGRDYRVGYGLGVLDRESLNFDLGVDAQRRESPMLGGASNGVLGRASLGW